MRGRAEAARLAAICAAWLLGCATPPSPRADLSRGGALAAHPEPDLVTARYRVAAGDTLYGIARTHGVSVRELSAANGWPEDRPLAIGEELVIPGGGDPAPAEVARPDVAARQERKTAPKVEVGRGEGVLQWPLRGVLYARFGKKGKEPHDGIDLAAPTGTPVKAAAPGSVLFAGAQPGYGLMVIVEHSHSLITLYAHNRDLKVKTGQKVSEGQVVATVGESGKTSGPHLHFEVRKAGNPVDPVGYLGPLPTK